MAHKHVHVSQKVSLVIASYHGEYSTVCDLVSSLPHSSLDKTATVEKVGSSGGDLHNCTALTIATIQGHTDIAKVLLEAGASHSIRDCTGSTAFSEAVYHNRPQLVDLLHGFGADINTVNSFGWTPLHVAAFQGNLKIVSKLLDLRADVEKATPEGYTPLHLATLSGKSPVVVYLLDKGISPCFVDINTSRESCSPCPLFLAVAGHFKGLVNRFLKHPDCPLSSNVDALMLMGAVDILDSRIKQAKSNWSKALQLRENHNISLDLSPCDGYNGRCEIADLTKLSELFEGDNIEIEAAYQSVIIWERCVGTVDQRYWQCLRQLIEKLVKAQRSEEAEKVIIRGLNTVESSQLPLLEKGCLLPQNFEVFFGDTLQLMVVPHLANRTVSFEAIFPYVMKALDVIISRGASLFNTFGCPNFVPKFLFGIILQMFELWLKVDVTLSEYEWREHFGRGFVTKYLYLSDGSNLLFTLLQSPCQNQTKLCEALLTWGASEAINHPYNGQRLFQKVLNVETAPQKQIVPSLLLKLLVSHGVHSDAVDSSGKSAIDCCPQLFGPSCPLPLACLAARTIIKDNLPYLDMLSVAPRLKKFITMHDIDIHCQQF